MHINKLFLLLFLSTCLTARAANTKTSVSQVSSAVTLTADVDYVVTGETPFVSGGSVNILNTEHAVLIVEKVKPSKVIASFLGSYVKINGQTAQNGVNCQVRLYGTRGSMVLPYASTDKPLTVYSEQNFGGESCSDFGLENDGGYMVTLTDKKLNNRIRSFRLKRGYMVTFATQKSGYGYQRCFIANNEDVEMSTLPQILDGKISSYRIFKWNTAGKKGLASSTDGNACDALNVISCYGWNTGKDMQPDVECVPHHLYEDYPTSSACGKVTYAAHMKTNNEPRNSADDRPQDLSTILGNWQNLMRTGMRLCSPSSWDGSDWTSGYGFIKEFLDAIDARGWRCDIVDLHCYWTIDNFNNIGTMQSVYKRPIWISEWMWGASWNKNGTFESGKTDGDIAWGVKQICEKLNSYGYVERYFYWTGETKGKVYSNGAVTSQVGTYYRDMLTGMGYNKNYEKIPDTPPMSEGFTNYQVTTSGNRAIITWHDHDGEYNQLMEVLRCGEDGVWTVWKTIQPEDAEADYSVTDNSYSSGVRYQLHIKGYSGKDYYSSRQLNAGDGIETESGTRYVGGNIIMNGDFQMGLDQWTNGTGQPLAQPWFEVFPKESGDGYFLQCLGSQGKDDASSVKTAFDVEPDQDYLFLITSRNAGNYIKVDLRQKGASSDVNKATIFSKDDWTTGEKVFNSGSNNEALLAFRWLNFKGQLSDIKLCRLFTTRAEALTNYQELQQEREQQLKPYVEARAQQRLDSLVNVATAVAQFNLYGREQLLEAIESSDAERLQQALDDVLSPQLANIQPLSPSFADTNGWQTKVGTYTGGDQRTATQEELTCWNAWWDGVSASEGASQTLEVKQTLSGLPAGLYLLECKASTQHYCLSDQHGYISAEGDVSDLMPELAALPRYAETPVLQYDYLDIPGTPGSWQTLTTTPIYVSRESETVTIGFVSSKQGAIDNAWRRYGEDSSGDKREGWWCATDFRLLYAPLTSTPTGLSDIGRPSAQPLQYFDLQGRRVEPSGKGIVIQKGEGSVRKVLLK